MAHRDSSYLSEKGIPLTRLKTGTSAIVLAFSETSSHDRNKLMALGVMPGASIRLLQRFPSYVIAIGYTQLALDKETAALIYVQPE
ncbi:MAG TPA: FeoA family protein [Chthonomonadales bacterium]|nr:FeoA family protein [Chthonomonadales bacterium]